MQWRGDVKPVVGIVRWWQASGKGASTESRAPTRRCDSCPHATQVAFSAGDRLALWLCSRGHGEVRKRLFLPTGNSRFNVSSRPTNLRRRAALSASPHPQTQRASAGTSADFLERASSLAWSQGTELSGKWLICSFQKTKFYRQTQANGQVRGITCRGTRAVLQWSGFTRITRIVLQLLRLGQLR